MASEVDMSDFSRVLEEVKAWPAETRLLLAESVMQSLHGDIRSDGRRGVPAKRVLGIAATKDSPPTDEQTEQWLEEHRQWK